MCSDLVLECEQYSLFQIFYDTHGLHKNFHHNQKLAVEAIVWEKALSFSAGLCKDFIFIKFIKKASFFTWSFTVQCPHCFTIIEWEDRTEWLLFIFLETKISMLIFCSASVGFYMYILYYGADHLLKCWLNERFLMKHFHSWYSYHFTKKNISGVPLEHWRPLNPTPKNSIWQIFAYFVPSSKCFVKDMVSCLHLQIWQYYILLLQACVVIKCVQQCEHFLH